MTDKIIPIHPATPSNRRSANITQGKSRAPNRSMYYAMGYEEGDFVKPMVGVANGHSTITPCNSGLQKLADAAVEGIEEAGGNAQIFGTPTISDGMAMGTEGMKYSLVSREVISDCIETCVQGQWMDGVLVVGGCDKNMPGGMMGMLRANVPAIYIYGGTILPGHYKGQDLNIVSVFEAVGQNAAGNLSDFDLHEINEAFSAAALALLKDLELDSAKVNVNGGAVALGHLIGGSGARILVTLLHAMKQKGAKTGMATLCLGGGNAVSLAVEAL